MLYTLHVHKVICQLYLNKDGKKKIYFPVKKTTNNSNLRQAVAALRWALPLDLAPSTGASSQQAQTQHHHPMLFHGEEKHKG